VTPSPFAGRVLVVAGDAAVLDGVTQALLVAGALVAVVGTAGREGAHVDFRVDPADADVWSRVVPHVEQRLGPVDGVVAWVTIHHLVSDVFEPDLRRRGHGAVVAVGADDDPADVLRQLADTL
jgi:hypothetical protein